MLLEDGDNELTPMGRDLFASLFEELLQLDKRIESFDKQLASIHRQSPQCRRIAEVEGIGPITATALVAAICDGKSFTNGRQLSAWLGAWCRGSIRAETSDACSGSASAEIRICGRC